MGFVLDVMDCALQGGANPTASALAAVLDGFRDIRFSDRRTAGKVGHRPREFEHPVKCARRPAQACAGGLEAGQAAFVGHAPALDVAGIEFGIGLALARQGQAARAFDALRDRAAGLAARGCGECFLRHCRHLDLYIDAIEQGARQPMPIAFDGVGRATASDARMPMMAARARVHGRHQLEARREFRAPRGPRDRNAPGFERLAQSFEHPAVELGEFIQEQDAPVGQTDFARARRIAAVRSQAGCDDGAKSATRAQ